jgi:methylenetetrahydrofolate reductase (NADPH)
LRIPVLYSQPQPTISFEFFPPKTDEAEETLFQETVPELQRLGAAFISVTYGAGGSTHDRSLGIVRRLIKDHQIETVAHLTCVGGNRETLGVILDEARRLGIENILALRGDPPKGQTEFKPLTGGFSYAAELVRFVKSRGQFTVGVAGYPEGHVECSNKILDWDRTAAKIAEGADYLITQLFYDFDDFIAFEKYLRTRHGIKVPIVPGILPFLGAAQIRRFASQCGAKIPEPMQQRLEEVGHDDEAVRKLGVELCTNLCRRLLDHGVPGLHIYCLNRAASARELLCNLGLARNL